jgi:hypothetical protein
VNRKAPGTEAREATAPGPSVETLVTYLEMTAPPERPATLPPGPAVEIRRAARPTTSFYRYLYDAVGRHWTWTERRLMSDAELAAIVQDPRVEVLVLWVDGVPAGYAELDRRAPLDIELAYFGLVPEFIGQGLGGSTRMELRAAQGSGAYLRSRPSECPWRLPKVRVSGVRPAHGAGELADLTPKRSVLRREDARR